MTIPMNRELVVGILGALQAVSGVYIVIGASLALFAEDGTYRRDGKAWPQRDVEITPLDALHFMAFWPSYLRGSRHTDKP